MGATKSYLIPVGDLTLDERRDMRATVDAILISQAVDIKIKLTAEELLIRDTLPNTDLGVGLGGPVVGVGTAEDWLDQIAGVVGAEHQYHSSVLAVDRCIAFYGVSIEAAPPAISRIRHTQGAASTQVRGVFQLESLYSRLEAAGYYGEPVVFVRNETVRTMVMVRTAYALLTQRIAFYARTVEPIGNVISAPSI